MQFSPFTFTGFLGSWQPTDQTAIFAGITTGWNNFFDGQPTTGAFRILNPDYPARVIHLAFLVELILKVVTKHRLFRS